MNVDCILEAARVPARVRPQTFGPWTIERRRTQDSLLGEMGFVGWPDYTLLRRVSLASLHLDLGEVVMEDSRRELARHLPIWLEAHGRVLITGLGLGCVVRGLLASPRVEHIDVVEIDPWIVERIGPEFVGNPRVHLVMGDALTVDLPGPWDFAWHDLWTDGDIHLQQLHARLMLRFRGRVRRQGAWAFPREFKRLYSRHVGPLLGAPRGRYRTVPA